jgi:hypothetical protein
LFIPTGGSGTMAAVIYSLGSGDSPYQNYAWGYVETCISDVFLDRDMAVLLVNKLRQSKAPVRGSDSGVE